MLTWGTGAVFTLLGVGLLLWLSQTTAPSGARYDVAASGAGSYPLLAIVAGLALSCGLAILGLAVGRWRRPVKPGKGLSQRADSQE